MAQRRSHVATQSALKGVDMYSSGRYCRTRLPKTDLTDSIEGVEANFRGARLKSSKRHEKSSKMAEDRKSRRSWPRTRQRAEMREAIRHGEREADRERKAGERERERERERENKSAGETHGSLL